MRFLGLGLADAVPDANTIWNFREALKRADAVQTLFARFDATLKAAGYLAMGGQIVDATIVAAPKQRNTEAERAAIKAGQVPEGWADKPAKLRQKAAYRLADNRIALNAGWDEALLAAEVAKLQEMGGLDLALTGFDAGEFDRLLAAMEPVATDPGNEPLASPAVASADAPGNEAPADDPSDAEPELPRQAVTRPGDLWMLGDHRLLCSDSTDAASVARVMGDDRATLLFTSPPYGNQRDYTTGGGTDCCIRTWR